MKILFIGGNGNISWWCVQKALEAGHTVYELNRGATLSTRRAIQPEVIKLTSDFRDKDGTVRLLANCEFDVVCDFICFNSEQARLDVELFSGRVSQFVFVSTTSVYQRKTEFLPFAETTPKWERDEFDYAAGKIKAEIVFMEAYKRDGFPVTIVRPAYTYDTIVPISVGHNCFTAAQRMIDGKRVLIAGDGTNLYTFTHSRDFASALVHLLGNRAAVGEDFHITTDEWLTWLDMTHMLLDSLGVKNAEFTHIPAHEILAMDVPVSENMAISYMGRNFANDRLYCAVFDNTKIKRFVPGWRAEVKFRAGIKETVNWLLEDAQRRRFNPDLDRWLDSLAAGRKSSERFIELLQK